MSAWKEWQVYEAKAIEAHKNGDEELSKKYEIWAEEAKINFEMECRREDY